MRDGVVELHKVHTHDNIADIFTKPLPKALFDKHARKLLNTRVSRNILMRVKLHAV